jgi:hypothetical protein
MRILLQLIDVLISSDILGVIMYIAKAKNKSFCYKFVYIFWLFIFDGVVHLALVVFLTWGVRD